MTVSIAVIVALVLLTASTGAMFKPGAWYRSLNRPAWTPPNWMFPVVWTVLYVMIGYAGWRVWESGNRWLLTLWFAQLAVNALWSYLFFGRRDMRLAMVDVLVLWSLIAAFIALAWSTQPLAALLFAPYALWVTTAATLNWQMIRLNPSEVRTA